MAECSLKKGRLIFLSPDHRLVSRQSFKDAVVVSNRSHNFDMSRHQRPRQQQHRGRRLRQLLRVEAVPESAAGEQSRETPGLRHRVAQPVPAPDPGGQEQVSLLPEEREKPAQKGKRDSKVGDAAAAIGFPAKCS